MIQTKKMRIMAHLSQLSRRQIITPQFAADRASSFHRGEVTLDDLIDELIMLPVTEENSVYSHFKQLLEDPLVYDAMHHSYNPFGDGHASKHIADILEFGSYDPWVAER